MSKLDKTLYSKEEACRLMEQRRKEKETNQESANLQRIIKPVDNFDSPIAFVLGNGTSRSGIEINDLIKLGTVYACNAVYRTHRPHYLVAVDSKMVIEINKSGYQLKNNVYTNKNRAYDKFRGFDFFDPSLGWSSGPTALHLASSHNKQEIYILGFDYKGINDKVNNIFADSPNYKKTNDRATYYGNWLRQTGIVIQKNPQKRYIRVTDKECFVPEPLTKLNNLSHIKIDEFIEKFGLHLR